MTNKIEWLRETTGFKAATPISRAHLSRMLANLDWLMLSVVMIGCFGEQTAQMFRGEWISAEGKAMRAESMWRKPGKSVTSPVKSR